MENQPKQGDAKRSEGKGRGRRNNSNHRFRNFEKKNPDAIPILKFGPSNNFMKFKEAISKKALEEFGAMGKLIKKGEIIEPKEPKRENYKLEDEMDKAIFLEDVKSYRAEIAIIKRNRPKLYALILKYLSDESLEAVQKGEDWSKIEEEVDPEGLWKLVEQKHKVHSASEVAIVVKLESRTQLQNIRQGSYESIISYKQRYTNALRAYHEQKNPEKEPVDQAMDFFHGLDNGRYADFKVDYLNGLQVKSIEPPTDLNEMFTLANGWLKPKALSGGGHASTYATRVDKVSKRDRNKAKQLGNKKDKEQDSDKGQASKNGKKQGKKLECYICGDEHYATACPHRRKITQADDDEENEQQEQHVNVALEANSF